MQTVLWSFLSFDICVLTNILFSYNIRLSYSCFLTTFSLNLKKWNLLNLHINVLFNHLHIYPIYMLCIDLRHGQICHSKNGGSAYSIGVGELGWQYGTGLYPTVQSQTDASEERDLWNCVQSHNLCLIELLELELFLGFNCVYTNYWCLIEFLVIHRST